MTTVHLLDDYYLAITLLITICYQLFFFSIAFSLKFDKLTDFAGGTNFALLAIITLSLSGHPNARQIVTSLFIIIWALRLSSFLLFRILKTGKDDRFDDKRDKFLPFLGFWIFQMLWVWIVSLPVTILNSPAVTRFTQPEFGTGQDIAGVLLFLLGFFLESISDIVKYRFRSTTIDKSLICNKAIFMIVVSPAASGDVRGQAYKALYATIVGPIFLTTLLMFVSGINLAERPTAKRRYENDQNWEEYARYLSRTSILIPFPPILYARLPIFLKRTLFLEFPLYVFDPAKHSNRVRE
ncbi:putative 3-oxo-5-alpha-steroid 4-dehydrogenase protein [Erysiphe neolycopersici]|uniref:Putative 3-oxo-5-alpha-steroid 4-dehydrogenase protein n=1 Tax=Erysiphe neolycopersici TaxID=212602 RepID=A0A420HAU5_9PEZI|nr:putative 3-oxo-5-alpha-steroid 4-dehydrogenase protein [Erysiphe neolycopersici]